MTYDDLIREVYGRAPTAEETRRHLTLNRMAKDSSLDVDPITMTLIACDMRMARPSAMGVAPKPSPVRDLAVFAIAMLVCVAMAVLSARWTPSFVGLILAGALGVLLALSYVRFSKVK